MQRKSKNNGRKQPHTKGMLPAVNLQIYITN